jgi:hypothetical protein
MKLFVVITALASAAFAQTPAGWQTMKERKQACQISVPAGWTADKIMPGNLTSPDKKANVILGAKPDSASYADITKMAKDMFKPTSTMEDSPNKTFFVEKSGKPGQTAWYVAINTKPVCEAQITFEGAGFEATAKQIAGSLKSAK